MNWVQMASNFAGLDSDPNRRTPNCPFGPVYVSVERAIKVGMMLVNGVSMLSVAGTCGR